MSLVQGVPSKVTLFARANGLLSVAASGVHVPPMLVEVQERKYRFPSLPMASTSSRYWSVPLIL
jgi:hypothetical protein